MLALRRWCSSRHGVGGKKVLDFLASVTYDEGMTNYPPPRPPYLAMTDPEWALTQRDAYDLATRPPTKTPRWVMVLIGILLAVISLMLLFWAPATPTHDLPACQEDEVLTWEGDFPGAGKVEVKDLHCINIESLTHEG
jgi:hypothetical protein